MKSKLNIQWLRLKFLTSFILLISLTATAQNSVPLSTPWFANGPISTTAKDPASNTLFIGGSFSSIALNTPNGTSINSSSGAPDFSYAIPDGPINAVIPDGNGGWYIGGQFTAVGGQARNRMAQINSSGQVTSWDPNADNVVFSLAKSGNTIYVGGDFTTIGGQTRSRLAALDPGTGTPTSWNPNVGNTVRAIAVNGNVVYIGGDFIFVNSVLYPRIASVDAITGVPLSWNPSANGSVNTLTISGNTMYVGGNFSTISGQTRNKIAAFDLSNSSLKSWNPNADGQVNAIIVSGGTIYVGGYFFSIGGQPRNFIAALDASTGNATSWDPDAGDGVNTLAAAGNIVYAGGFFTTMGGQSRNFLASINTSNGVVTAWNPNANDAVNILAVNGNYIYAGGYFTGLNSVTRNHIAALDATTGAPKSWNPDVDGNITSLALGNGLLYIGGGFSAVGGQSRSRIASINLTTGQPTSWNPTADNYVNAIILNGSTVYAGGDFTTIAGQPRNHLAAFDATTGLLSSWNPNANGGVGALALKSSTLYAGGSFTTINGQSRSHLAAISTSTGLPTSWNPNANNSVFALAISGNLVYGGGYFTTVGGQTRNYVAAIDATTGIPTSWNPNADNQVLALAVNGNKVFAGGSFYTIGGQSRHRMATLDASTGLATSWNPDLSGDVNTVTFSNSTLYVGGGFTTVGGQSHQAFAYFNVCANAAQKPGVITQSGGATKVCPGETRSYSIVDVANAYTYNWLAPVGAFITSGQGTTSILVSFNSAYPASDTIKVRAESDCGSSAYRFLVVHRGTNPPAPGIITQSGGDPKICPGQTRTFTIAPLADISNYSWTVPTGATITSGQGTTSIVVSFNGSLAAVDTVKVASVNGCGTSVNRILKIYRGSGPHAPGVITQSGATKVCPGETRTYTIAAVPGAASYSWVVPSGASITSGQGTTSINVSFNGSFGAADTIKVRTGDACGNSAYRLKIVTRAAAPKAPSAITGETKGLCDQDGVAYSVTNTAGNTYAWSFNNANGSVATGQGTSAITANFTPGASSTTLSVTAANGCGTSAPRAAVFSAKPAKPASMTGASAVCAHAMGVQYSTPAVYGATTYTWGAPSGSTISDGVVTSTGVILTTTSHTVTVNFGASAGDVKVRADNGCASSGFFFKLVTMGCKTIGGTPGEAEGSDDIIVYPNPATDQVNITFQSHNPGSSYSIHLYDVLGKEVITTNGTTITGTNQTQLNTSILASGVYHLVLKGEGLDYNTKVVLDK